MIQDTLKSQSDLTFGDKPSFSTDDIFAYALSDDKKAWTITFNGLEAAIGSDKAPKPAPVTSRAFSIVVPLAGKGPVKTTVSASGFGLASDGADGTLVFIINGDSRVFKFGPKFEGDIVHQFAYEAAGQSELRITLFLLVERSAAVPGAAAFLNVTALDTDLALTRA